MLQGEGKVIPGDQRLQFIDSSKPDQASQEGGVIQMGVIERAARDGSRDPNAEVQVVAEFERPVRRIILPPWGALSFGRSIVRVAAHANRLLRWALLTPTIATASAAFAGAWGGIAYSSGNGGLAAFCALWAAACVLFVGRETF